MCVCAVGGGEEGGGGEGGRGRGGGGGGREGGGGGWCSPPANSPKPLEEAPFMGSHRGTPPPSTMRIGTSDRFGRGRGEYKDIP